MHRIRRFATAAAIAAAAVLGACAKGVLPDTEPLTPGADGPSNVTTQNLPPLPQGPTVQSDTTSRCGGQMGSSGGRC